jgi:hypothetical protein
MAICPVTDTSVWISQQYSFSQQPSEVSGSIQEHGGDEGQGRRVHDHHRGGMSQALMQTLKQLVQSMPSNSSTQNATDNNSDSDQNGSRSQAGSVRTDLNNFMHALFQAIRSQEQSSPSFTSAYPTGFDGSKFESSLSSLISQLASDSGLGNLQISDLQNTFNTLVQDLQNGPSDGSNAQPSQTVSLQNFLTTLQQNLLDSRQPIPVTGNVVNIQG